MRRFPGTLLLTSALALGGCNLAPNYVRPAMPVSATLPTGGVYDAGRNGTAAQTAAVAPADVAWRDFFTDPKLRNLIALALANNRDLRVAVANVAQYRAQLGAQRADLFPTIAGTGSATYQKSSAATLGGATGAAPGGGNVITTNRRIDIYSANIGVSAWEIDLFGRVRNLTQEAFERYLSSQEARNGAQVTLIADVANAYLTMAADQETLRIARETEKAFGETLALTRRRFSIGVASELDVRQAQSSYDSARTQIAQSSTLVAQDQNALTLLVGTTIPAELLPAGLDPKGATIDALPAGLSSDVLLRRPDIAEAEHNLRAANADIGAARAAFFPQISLTAALGSLSLGLSNLFSSGTGTWSVAPSATQTLFDFGRNKSNLRYSKASRDVAVAQYEKAIQTGFREVADALARRGTIDAQIDAQQSLRDAAAVSYRLSEARFRTGIASFLDTLDSQRTLFSAEQTLVTTRLTRQTNLVELYRSLGGGLS
ncbi:efflux transporter outer membrane subunit [Sphingomonas sp.]|uniref:efflux transporter outer membrane subunit n=1 Tax=Sphingomonas sp. TaxID=28214 RepID=UPI003B3B8524